MLQWALLNKRKNPRKPVGDLRNQITNNSQVRHLTKVQ